MLKADGGHQNQAELKNWTKCKFQT